MMSEEDPTIYYEWQKGSPETIKAAIEERRTQLLELDLAAHPSAQKVCSGLVCNLTSMFMPFLVKGMDGPCSGAKLACLQRGQ